MLKIISVAVISVLMLSGCVTNSGRSVGANEQFGTVSGAIIGGVIGNQFGSGGGRAAATIGGAILGGLVGNSIGQSYDERDRYYYNHNRQQALTAPVGQNIVWNNPDNGNRISVTPTKDGYDGSGRYCREYMEDVTINGKREKAYGTACRNSDGSWKINN